MGTVQEDILNEFFAKLSKVGSIDQATTDVLREALTSGKKLKADDIVAILRVDPKDKAP